MFFITTLNGVITGLHDGDLDVNFFGQPYHGHEKVPVGDISGIRVFDKVEFYDKNWKRKSDIQLIDEGLIPMPIGYVRENNELRAMTQTERIIGGLDKPQLGFKVVNREIVPMTLAEQLEAGQITKEIFEQSIVEENENKLQSRLAELQTPEALARIEVDTSYAEKRKAKLKSLLEVKSQKDWPLKVKWPD